MNKSPSVPTYLIVCCVFPSWGYCLKDILRHADESFDMEGVIDGAFLLARWTESQYWVLFKSSAAVSVYVLHF